MTKEEILKSLEDNKKVPDGTFYLYLTPLVIAKCGGKEKIEEISSQIFLHTVKVVEIPSVYKEQL